MPAQQLALDIAREIREITRQLVTVGLVDNQNSVVHLPGSEGRWQVTQSGADMSVALRKAPYAEVYLDLAASNNYALLLLDGAMIQFSYSGQRRQIVQHRLAYLPSPDLLPYQNDPELYFGEHHFVDVVGHQVVPVPIRLDFDNRPDVPVDVVHPVSHMTLGQYQHCRIPVTRAVTPVEFTRFIIGNFYSTPAEPRHTFGAHVSGTWPSTITAAERLEPMHIALA